MANAFGLIGAGAGASAGVEGVQRLAELLAQRDKQLAVAAELDARRQGIDVNRQQVANQREYQTGTLERQKFQDQLAQANAAANLGNYSLLAQLTGQPPESFKRHDPINTLQEGLARAIEQSRARQGPIELGMNQPAYTAGEDLSVQQDPMAQVWLDALKEVNRSAHPGASTPFDRRVEAIYAKPEDQRTVEEKGLLIDYEAKQTGQTPRTSPERRPSNAFAVADMIREKLNRGEPLTAADKEVYDMAKKYIETAAGLRQTQIVDIPNRTGVAGGQLARQTAEDKAEREERWRNTSMAVMNRVAQTKAKWDELVGALKERSRQDTLNTILGELQALHDVAPDEVKKAEIRARMDQARKDMRPPLVPGGRRVVE